MTEEVQNVQTVSVASLVYGRGTDMVVSGRSCEADAEGTPVPSSVCDSVSKLSTEDEAIESEGESSVILKSGLKSLAMEMDGIDSWSIEMVESRLFPVVTTETETPPLLFM